MVHLVGQFQERMVEKFMTRYSYHSNKAVVVEAVVRTEPVVQVVATCKLPFMKL